MPDIDRNWYVISVGRDSHVVPRNDTHPHTKGRRCACDPVLEDCYGDALWIGDRIPAVVSHQAYDKRTDDE